MAAADCDKSTTGPVICFLFDLVNVLGNLFQDSRLVRPICVQHLAIEEHLERHSYYHLRKGNRELATVFRMRNRILDLCKNYAKPNMPKPNECDKEFKDKVDVLATESCTKQKDPAQLEARRPKPR